MKSVQMLTLYVVAGLLMIVSVDSTEASTKQSWDPSLVAYSYDYYADPEKTEYLGTVQDACISVGENVIVSNPNIPTPYYNQTPMYVCSGMGPYLPGDWPY